MVLSTVTAQFYFEDDVFFEGMPQVVINNTEITEAQTQSNSLLSQLFQITSNLFSATVFGTGATTGGTCQVIVDNNLDFSSPEVNQQAYISEYTHNDYLATGYYYVKVKCSREGYTSMWSEVKGFAHSEARPFYIDWSLYQ